LPSGAEAGIILKKVDHHHTLPEDGETFIGIPTPWLKGYLEMLERELTAK